MPRIGEELVALPTAPHKNPQYIIVHLTPEQRIARTKEDIRAFLEIARTTLPREESLDQAAWRVIATGAARNPEYLQRVLKIREEHSNDALALLHIELKELIDAIKSQKNKIDGSPIIQHNNNLYPGLERKIIPTFPKL